VNRSRLARSAPPESFFVGSAVFHYLGPAFAVLLFALVEPLGVAWLRIVSAAAVFTLWRRPWRVLAGLDANGRRTLVAMGAVLAAMNSCFYLAIDRLPLGTVAAIEFLPVIALAAVGMRTARNAFALAGAVAGVYLLTDVRIEGEPVGVGFAFANAALFALYIVLAHRIARADRMTGVDGLGAAMVVAALAITPIGAWSAAPALLDPIALLAGVGVGISSSVIPYVFDQLAMARMSRATYSLMVSLLPATATVVGLVVLSQIPTPTDVLGIGLVVAGVAVHRSRKVSRSQKVWSAVPHKRPARATISPSGNRSHRRRSPQLSQNGKGAAGERGLRGRRRGG
jgi:inner membrane transporter RhtA